MKTTRSFLAPFIVLIAIGLISFLSQCKKKTETVEVEVLVHDTLKGKSISGNCTYPDFSNTQVSANGAVVTLYLGSSASGTPVATAISDTSGNYIFPYLLPNTYFITASYNTDNQNNKNPINGISFETNPGYAVTLGSANLTQNLTLSTVAPTGTLKIAIDTSVNLYRKVSMETHSKVEFWMYHNSNQQLMQGGFNVFKVTKFAFDEANLTNSVIDGYVLLSTVNTFEPTRDAIGTGCVQKTLNVDTTMSGTTITVMPETDTVRYYSTSIEKYGNGYLCHGILKGFYKHGIGETRPSGTTLPADTAGGYTGPFDVQISKAVDMYFEYQGKTKMYNSAGTTFNWYFTFEGEFKISKSDFYIVTSAISDELNFTPHVTFKGTNNIEY